MDIGTLYRGIDIETLEMFQLGLVTLTMENTATIEDSPTYQDIMNKSANFFYQDMFAKMFLFSLRQILFYEKSCL
jgi:hypothetical protein